MSGTSGGPIRAAIVGSGIIGHNHALAMLRHPRLRVDAVVDPDAAANAALADRITGNGGADPGRFATLADAFADREIDLVVICTPSGMHVEAAAESLAAGKHVVIEKPVDVSLPRAGHLVKLAREAELRGQVCAVISQHRFDPASVAVAQAVAQGRLGTLTSAVASVAWWRSQAYYDSAGWRGTWELDGGGATMNQGIHTVDLLVWLLGQPTEVFAYTGRLAHERIEVEDVAVASIRFASGALAVLHATTAAYPGLSVRLQIHGSRGSAIINDDQLEYFYAAPDADAPDPAGPVNLAAAEVPAADLHGAAKPADNFIVGHLRQYDDIVNAIDQGTPSSIGVSDALLALAVVKAIYLSAELAQPIEVQTVIEGAFDTNGTEDHP
ncbi:putative dehydrogenase [Allocatelliglobosispora scoriae]|uniref:Putative dehydrogenase n=1 Tax=Allocatelliglobosispora scoriae TaxID=643052 RepID=A0A841BYU3_9ACTN|nr:Gfo/Idh/MocA family oxidoreductase [Allocatelliglobosispora scoriae]MBB5872658.1 putative dehydrogenase [Allocatelliglobosispora scoriae]